jgi:2-polyprenyl-6-hydroxyphenyl methylase/3-demethylubiquinone-9 3-methyltransferase
MNEHQQEVEAGGRFEFGQNWKNFLKHVDAERAELATQSFATMLGTQSLNGFRFLDIGSGSGLFSLAARMLGAHVTSFDYDPQSVACTRELKRRFRASDMAWVIESGSVLDTDYLRTLGRFDIVYSWGVLHHTGAMWKALENVAPLVKPGGQLFISLYNDQGAQSKRWHTIKRMYNNLPQPLRGIFGFTVMGARELRFVLGDTLKGRPWNYITRWTEFHLERSRGMSRWHDLVDWVGGYPFEVSKPEQIFDFFTARGFRMTKLTTCGGSLGCNEYIFSKQRQDELPPTQA